MSADDKTFRDNAGHQVAGRVGRFPELVEAHNLDEIDRLRRALGRIAKTTHHAGVKMVDKRSDRCSKPRVCPLCIARAALK